MLENEVKNFNTAEEFYAAHATRQATSKRLTALAVESGKPKEEFAPLAEEAEALRTEAQSKVFAGKDKKKIKPEEYRAAAIESEKNAFIKFYESVGRKPKKASKSSPKN